MIRSAPRRYLFIPICLSWHTKSGKSPRNLPLYGFKKAERWSGRAIYWKYRKFQTSL